jgi:hypothetical protein
VAQPTTDDQPKALKAALESMTLLVAAVIVHDQEPVLKPSVAQWTGLE